MSEAYVLRSVWRPLKGANTWKSIVGMACKEVCCREGMQGSAWIGACVWKRIVNLVCQFGREARAGKLGLARGKSPRGCVGQGGSVEV